MDKNFHWVQEESMLLDCSGSNGISERRLLAVSKSAWLYLKIVRHLRFTEHGGRFMLMEMQLWRGCFVIFKRFIDKYDQ